MPNIQILTSLSQAPKSLFESQTSPFLSHAFWLALENSGSISAERGWSAAHILLHDDAGKALALLPVFAKNHHRGEYVFDHAWADAYARNGLDYYPRLVTCVPFTPVVGSRVWLAADVQLDDVSPLLLAVMQQLVIETGASSWHGLFIEADEISAFTQAKHELAVRYGCHFLWENRSYGDFNGFLAEMTAKRRKTIKAERAKITQMGIQCTFIEGQEIDSADWDFFYDCYARTYHVRGQNPYLTLDFFKQIGRSMADQLVLQIAHMADGNALAAALFFKDKQTLYGRYWGAMLDVDCLHFEVCYYQGIEYALSNGLRYFDPGTQGEHKLTRGFAPVYTQSLHWLAHPPFMQAVRDFVNREKQGIRQYHQAAQNALPFKIKPSTQL